MGRNLLALVHTTTDNTTPPPPSARHAGPASAVQAVFEHWVFMLGKAPGRVAMGPARRAVIEKALRLYEVETLLLAVEGNAASRFHAGDNKHGRTFNDLELILRDEAHIEGFAEQGEALRERADREAAAREQALRSARTGDQLGTTVDAGADRARLAKIRQELVARIRGAVR